MYYSCIATLFGNFYVLGGSSQNGRQVFTKKLYDIILLMLAFRWAKSRIVNWRLLENYLSVKCSKWFLLTFSKLLNYIFCLLINILNIFSFQHGSCSTYLLPTEKLLMCFDRNKKSGCRTYVTHVSFKNIRQQLTLWETMRLQYKLQMGRFWI